MKKVRLLAFAFFVSLFFSQFATASVKDCYEEGCPSSASVPSLDSYSSSNFFLEDVNDLQAVADISPIPTAGQFWPVGGIITGTFGKWRGGRHRGHYHVGVDIAAPYGSPIVSPLKGKVEFVGVKGGYGLTVIIDHGDGVATLYAHNSHVFVNEGDSVTKGQEISKIGLSGRSTGPHLHYEVRVEGQPVSPLAWTNKLQIKKL